MGLKFSDKTSLQHASRAATADQSKSMKLPPLISPYKSKLVLLLADGKQVWPEEPVALHACKLFFSRRYVWRGAAVEQCRCFTAHED